MSTEATILPGRPGYKAQKSRGAYLQWLDNEIRDAKQSYEQARGELSKQHGMGWWEALVRARKAFTDEFYPK